MRRSIRKSEASVPATELLTVIDETLAMRVMDLAMRVAEVMLSVGASAKEVTLAIFRITRAYGLTSVHVDVTYTSITVSDHRSESHAPTTLMRVVAAAVPDHTKLQSTQALVASIESGMPLEAARAAFRLIRRKPFPYRPIIVIISQALLAVAVGVMYGAPWLALVTTFVAALAVAAVQAWLAKLRVPLFFSQIVGAFVLTAVTVGVAILSRNDIGPFEDVRPSIVIASGIVLMLAGLAVVGAAQDAIDGFALTAGGRILDLTLQMIGVVLGIVIGLQLASALGIGMRMGTTGLPFGPYPMQIVGAVLVALAVAVMFGASGKIIAVSMALAGAGWLVYGAATAAGVDATTASFLAALAASSLGAIFAYRLHVPSVAVTTAAIIPLVPGGVLFRGLLGMVEAGDDTIALIDAGQNLIAAALIGIALAAGASLGLFIGAPLRTTLDGVRMRVRTSAPPRAAAGTGISVSVPPRGEDIEPPLPYRAQPAAPAEIPMIDPNARSEGQ